MVSAQNSSYITTGNSSASTWLTDSSCNAHMTIDLGNLSISFDYDREENVSVGSGHCLPITHSSCGTFKTPNSTISFSNLLCVPHIATNLLSVHQLCVDNNCIIIFYSDHFFIQDKCSGQILFKGSNVNGLYPSSARFFICCFFSRCSCWS